MNRQARINVSNLIDRCNTTKRDHPSCSGLQSKLLASVFGPKQLASEMRKAIHARTDARPPSASLGVASSAEYRKNFINNTEHQLQPSKEFDLEPKKQKAGMRKLGTSRIASRGPVVHPVARRQKTGLISASFKQKNTCIAPALNIRLQVAGGRDQQGDSTLQLYIQDHVTQADGSSSSGQPNMDSQSTPCTSRIRPSSCSLNGRQSAPKVPQQSRNITCIPSRPSSRQQSPLVVPRFLQQRRPVPQAKALMPVHVDRHSTHPATPELVFGTSQQHRPSSSSKIDNQHCAKTTPLKPRSNTSPSTAPLQPLSSQEQQIRQFQKAECGRMCT